MGGDRRKPLAVRYRARKRAAVLPDSRAVTDGGRPGDLCSVSFAVTTAPLPRLADRIARPWREMDKNDQRRGGQAATVNFAPRRCSPSNTGNRSVTSVEIAHLIVEIVA